MFLRGGWTPPGNSNLNRVSYLEAEEQIEIALWNRQSDLIILTPKEPPRHRQHGKSADPNTRTREIQHAIQTPRQHPRGDDRRDNTEHAAPETRQARSGASDGGGEGFGGPGVEEGVEHALEEIDQGVDGDVGRMVVDGGEGEEARGEQRRRNHEREASVLPP